MLRETQARVAELEAIVAGTLLSASPSLLASSASDAGNTISMTDIFQRYQAGEQKLRQYSQRSNVLFNIDLNILEESSIQAVVRAVAEQLQRYLPCPYLRIVVLDRFNSELASTTAEFGTITEEVERYRDTRHTWFERTENNPISIIDDLATLPNPNAIQQPLIERGLRSALHGLVTVQGRSVGLLTLAAPSPRFFTDEHREFINVVINQIAIAVRYFRLSEEFADHVNELEQAIYEIIRTDEAFRKSETNYRSVVEDQTDLICRYDADFNLTFVNRAYAELYGKTVDELIGTSLLKNIPASEIPQATAAVRTLNSASPVSTSEHQTIMPDGSLRWHQWKDRALLDEEGNIFEYQGVGRDITAQRLLQAEQTQHAREIEQMRRFLQTTLDTLSANVAVLDPQGTILSVNAPWKRFSESNGGDTTGHYLGTNYLTVCDNATEPLAAEGRAAAAGIRRVIAGKQDDFYLEYPCHAPNAQRWFGMRVSAFDEPAPRRVVITHTDISERKLAEETLQAARDTLEQRVAERTGELNRTKDRVEAVLNNSADAILLAKADLSIQQTNLVFNTLFACRPDDYFGNSLLELIHPEDVALVTEFIQVNTTESQRRSLEIRAQRQDGTAFDAEFSISTIGSINHPDRGIVCTIRDIVDRKKRERELRYHASLQANVTDSVISTDLNFIIQSWNPAAERIYGWRADETIGKHVAQVLNTIFRSNETRERITQEFLERGYWTDEVIQYHRDGSVIHILGSTVLFKDDRGRPLGIVSVNHDITERKKAEQELQARTEAERIFQNYLKELHEISIALTLTEQLDDFYKRAVELGISRLGFERLGLMLYDPERKVALCTFGTDAQGHVTDERGRTLDPNALTGILGRTLDRAERFSFDEASTLYDNFKPLGTGWNAAAMLWNGKQSLGWLAADNAIHHTPASKPQLDILALYALTIGTLLGRKQAEAALRESEANLRSVMNSTSIGIILVDRDGVIRVANQLAYEYSTWLYHQTLIAGHTRIYDLSSDPAASASRFNRVFAGERFTHEISRQVDSQRYVLDFRYDPVIASDGEVIGAAVSFINITEHKRAEEALQLAFEKEKELGELKSRFVSMASHEFRTPLATIFAFTETLSAYRHRMTEAEIEQRLNNIRGQVEQLEEIVVDVLQLARLQARRMEFNPARLNFELLCREIVDEYEQRPDIQHHIRYVCDAPIPAINLDRKLIRQLIGNLIANAIKYSAPGSSIFMTLEQINHRLVLRVRDEGIGIPDADLKHLFEPFHRAGNVGAISGTGLGLTIAKEAVELHGGTIAVETQVGVGTTFIVSLPITEEQT